jgi:signal transduction histidine kinase
MDSNYLDRALKRERASRALSESLLEKQTRDLYLTNETLKKQNTVVTQYSKKIELFLSVIQMSHEVLEFKEQLKYFVKNVCEMSDWPVGHIYLPRGTEVKELFSSGIWYFQDKIYAEFKEETEKTTFKKGIGLSGRVFETKKALWIRELKADPNFPRLNAAIKDNLQGAFALPIIIDSKIVAIAEFFFNKIVDEDVYILQIIEAAAQQLALSIEKQQQKLKHQKILDDMNRNLISAARQAGMAEVATSVLHNIGNIMNSVNVAALSLSEKLNATNFRSLTDAAELIKTHEKNFDDFINNDPQGKSLIEYINKVPKFWEDRKKIFKKELLEINKKIENIKEVIAMQQSLSGALGVVEETLLIEVIEEALKLSKSIFPNSNLNIVKAYAVEVPVWTDKVKLLQILVNLIRNAYEAMQGIEIKNNITIELTKYSNTEVCIKIIDGGKGIAHENLTKIFSYGFTTRKNGHGIGLHTSALAARELGGSLMAESLGEGYGATFKLVLPIQPNQEKKGSS